jgi:glycosyltransferase involved in cell wall biosynthesis
MNKIKLPLFLVFLCLLYHFADSFCDKRTDGFSVARIHSALPYNPHWETASPTADNQREIEVALSQPFHYLACGGQCFAFSSDDGKYVIKFFKHRIRKPYSYLMYATLPGMLDQMRQRKLDKAYFKINRDFCSYKLAFEELQRETGLVYVHLNKGGWDSRNVSIVDKIGIKHQIPLDGVEFVLQKRGTLAHAHIDALVKAGDLEKTRHAFHAMLETIVSRCKKGVFDEDPRIYRNFGFIDNKPFFIDVGRFIPDPKRKDPEIYRADVLKITHRFRKWLLKTHPKLVTILDEELREFHT